MRSDCNGFAIAFEIDGVWRCYRCWERYAPQRPLQRPSLIGSSAGTTAAHGALYGSWIK